MASNTVGLKHISAAYINFLGNHVKMGWPNAQSCSAQVVNYKTLWYRAAVHQVRNAMSILHALRSVVVDFPVHRTASASPQPAGISLIDLLPESFGESRISIHAELPFSVSWGRTLVRRGPFILQESIEVE